MSDKEQTTSHDEGELATPTLLNENDADAAPEEAVEEAAGGGGSSGNPLHALEHINGMYRDWFLEYASYVILDRAVPALDDGLKPVQRRLLHAMFELEDGRYNKAANIIGHTMCYHPHGDAAIADALVKLAQKELLIDTQGNWGNPITGDDAAASRYIEARLSKFAVDVLFNKELTEWQLSYDGRRKEPLALPVKFPLLLMQGVEGIAVGLATKILPHNFNEIIKASIAALRGKKFELYPDFITGAVVDVSGYKDGERGGKVKVRAVIDVVDSKTLRIREIPFGVTTSALIDSILGANEKGKIKIKSVEDNTASEVDIVIRLAAGISPEMTVEALYAFTDCEVSISVNCCVIENEKPIFCSVSNLLAHSTERTRELLRQELDLKRRQLKDKMYFAMIERIFIEERIYRKIEKSETWEDVLATIGKSMKPFKDKLGREVSDEDCEHLTEIKIKRVSKFDSDRADEQYAKLAAELKQVEHHLANLTEYAVEFFKELQKKYGKGRDRRTAIDTFGAVKAAKVVLASQKLYVNHKEGFIGTSLKKDQFVSDCSDLDEVIAFCKDGKFMVSKVSPKTFIGKNIIHVSLFDRDDERCIFHLIYQDGTSGGAYAKRFNVTSVTRDRLYDLTRGEKGSKVLYFSVNPDGESEKVSIQFKDRARPLIFDFATLEVKARGVVGYMITKEPVKEVVFKEKGHSTLGAQKVWFDRTSGGLGTSEQGEYLGEFKGDDKILVVYKSGALELTPFSLSNHYGEDVLEIKKYVEGQVLSVVYFEGEREQYFVKRFAVDPETFGRRQEFITAHEKSHVVLATAATSPIVKVTFHKNKKVTPPSEMISLASFIDIRSFKALGSKISAHAVKTIDVVG
jgi:topoisomerase-4 subunit A